MLHNSLLTFITVSLFFPLEFKLHVGGSLGYILFPEDSQASRTVPGTQQVLKKYLVNK